MTCFAPRPPRLNAAIAIALIVLASWARPTRALAGFPDPVDVQAPCSADYECNRGVCRKGYCECMHGFVTLNASRPCWENGNNYAEVMILTWVGLSAWGVQAFVLGWTWWGLAIVLLMVVALVLRCCALYAKAQRRDDDNAELLLPTTKRAASVFDNQAEIVGCCGSFLTWVWAALALAVAVIATVHCVDARGVPCA